MIIAVGQRASLDWLPEEFKNERGTIKIDRFGRLGDTNFFAAGDIAATRIGSAADGGQCRRRRQARRLQSGQGCCAASNLSRAPSPIDVIVDLNRMNMTYFPHFPRVQQAMLAPASRAKTQQEVIQAFSEEQAVEEAGRCFSCGTCNACDNCYLVCPEPCIVRPSVRTDSIKFWSTTAKVAACASKSVRRDAWKACRNWTSIRASCEWIRRSRFRPDCMDGRRKSCGIWPIGRRRNLRD